MMTDDHKTTGPEMAGTGAGKPGIRWGRIVLVASLAMNLAVLGIVGGAALRWSANSERANADRVRMLQARDFGFGPFVGAFDSSDRRALGRDYIRSAGRADVARQQVGTMFRDMVSMLKAEPFNRAGFEALFLKQQQQFAERQEIGAHVLIDRIDAMSPEERMAYAGRLEEMLRHPPHPHSGGEAPPPEMPREMPPRRD